MPNSPTSPLSGSLSKLSNASTPDSVLSSMPKSGVKNTGGGSGVSFSTKGMTIQSGKDTLNLSAGKLSIKSGNTSFDMQSLSNGIKMHARDDVSKKSSTFQMTSQGTTWINEGPKSYSKVMTRTDAFKDQAQEVSDNLWSAGMKAGQQGRKSKKTSSFDDSIFEPSSRSSKGSPGPRSRRNSI